MTFGAHVEQSASMAWASPSARSTFSRTPASSTRTLVIGSETSNLASLIVAVTSRMSLAVKALSTHLVSEYERKTLGATAECDDICLPADGLSRLNQAGCARTTPRGSALTAVRPPATATPRGWPDVATLGGDSQGARRRRGEMASPSRPSLDRDRAPDEHEDARPRPIAREEEQGRRDPHDEGAHDGHERRHRGHGAQERGLGHAGHREAGARDGSLGERGPEVADDHSATEPLRLAKEPARMVRVDGHEAHGAPGEFGPVPRDEEHRRGREEEREQGLEE